MTTARWWRWPRCRCASTPGSDGAVETDPEGLWQSVLAAGRQALAGAGDPALDAVALANQGETVLAWDPATGAPLTDGHRLAGPARRARVRPPGRHTPTLLAEITGLQLDPYFAAPKMAWLRRGADHRRRRRHHRHLAGAPADRRVHRPTRPPPLAPCSSTSTPWPGRRGPRALRPGRRAPGHRSSANDAVVGTTTAFGAEVAADAGTCVDQQAALLRRSAAATRRGQMHLRHGRVPPGQTGARPAPHQPASSAASPGGSAAARTTAWTGRSTRPPPPCAGSPTSA